MIVCILCFREGIDEPREATYIIDGNSVCWLCASALNSMDVAE